MAVYEMMYCDVARLDAIFIVATLLDLTLNFDPELLDLTLNFHEPTRPIAVAE